MKGRPNPKACAALCTDGTRCGQVAVKGESLCSLHRAQVAGVPFNGGRLNPPRPRDPEEVIQALLRDKDPNVRLRAVDIWQKRFEGRARSGGSYAELWKAATDDEKRWATQIFDALAALKDQIYSRCPHLEPDDETLERRRRAEDERAAQEIRDRMKQQRPAAVVEDAEDDEEPADAPLPADFDVVSEGELAEEETS